MSEGSPIQVPLYRGRTDEIVAYAIVDAIDAPIVLRHRWHLFTSGTLRKGHYATRRVSQDGQRSVSFLHRELFNLPPGRTLEVDHINRDGLDNRRCNLRLLTPAQNLQNKGAYTGARSVYRGVYWDGHRERWVAQTVVAGKKYSCRADSELEAAQIAEGFRRQFMPYAVEATV